MEHIILSRCSFRKVFASVSEYNRGGMNPAALRICFLSLIWFSYALDAQQYVVPTVAVFNQTPMSVDAAGNIFAFTRRAS